MTDAVAATIGGDPARRAMPVSARHARARMAASISNWSHAMATRWSPSSAIWPPWPGHRADGGGDGAGAGAAAGAECAGAQRARCHRRFLRSASACRSISRPRSREQKARQLAKNAGGRARRRRASTLITAAQALAEFRTQSGFGAALDALTDNPLPNVLTIRPAPGATSPAQLEALRGYLLAWPEVDSVQLDRDWVLRFSAILDLLRSVVLITAVLLGAGVIAVVGNTIRLEILNRRAEIEVTKLVGGSQRVRAAAVSVCRRALRPASRAHRLGPGGARARWPGAGGGAAGRSLWQSVHAAGPDLPELGILLLAGVVLGWLGAWIAAARQCADRAAHALRGRRAWPSDDLQGAEHVGSR